MKIKSLILMAAALVMVACGGNNTKKADNANVEAAEAVVNTMEVDALLAEAEALVGQQIEIEGVCTHICSHGGTKIFLMGSDDSKTIRVNAAEVGSFDQKCVNSIVKVKGTLREERIDEAYLQSWEAKVATKTKDHHDSEGGCDSEKASRGETASTSVERIADFRAKIAARNEAEGKEYLSFYFVDAQSYEIVE